MKKKSTLIFAIGLLFSFSACSDGDNNVGDNDNTPPTPNILVAQPELNFPTEGGTETLAIKSDVTLEVASNDESWCRVALTASSAGDYTYTVTADANTFSKERAATITITGGSASATVEVTQFPGDDLFVQTTEYDNVSGAGETIQVKYFATNTPVITCNDSWITEATTRLTLDAQYKSFQIEANDGAAREGSITFTVGELTKTVCIKQLAGE